MYLQPNTRISNRSITFFLLNFQIVAAFLLDTYFNLIRKSAKMVDGSRILGLSKCQCARARCIVAPPSWATVCTCRNLSVVTSLHKCTQVPIRGFPRTNSERGPLWETENLGRFFYYNTYELTNPVCSCLNVAWARNSNRAFHYSEKLQRLLRSADFTDCPQNFSEGQILSHNNCLKSSAEICKLTNCMPRDLDPN